MKSVLLVIDMQRGFLREHDPSIIDKVNASISKHNGPVLYVEYSNVGPTDPRIVRKREGKRIWRTIKHDDGGGYKVNRALRRRFGSIKPKLKVVGINTPYCVDATARELAGEYGWDVEVIGEATACPHWTEGKTRLEVERMNKHYATIKGKHEN